ncbi:MAG: RnfH family protein [Panacagrimonas sp.]
MADLIRITVEVAYLAPGVQDLRSVELSLGATLRQAVMESGVLARCPEIDTDHCALGVFGRLRSPDSLLADGDRVEIYRPLQVDPKAARRTRARRAIRAGVNPG